MRKTIPDLATWVQCFGLYVAVMATVQPQRVPELMAYQAIIAKARQTYRRPSWIVYDQTFWQEMAGEKGQSWARVDPSVCFFGQNMNTENWCSTCRSLDYTSATCPVKALRKRRWLGTALGSLQRPSHAKSITNLTGTVGTAKTVGLPTCAADAVIPTQ